MSITLTVPSGSKTVIAATGGLQTTATTAAGFSMIDVALLIDGSLTAAGGFSRIYALNNGGVPNAIAYFTLMGPQLAPGVHTVQVVARGTGSGSNATVGGDSSSVLQGQLSVTVLKL